MNPLAVKGPWTYQAREELKVRGFRYLNVTREWIAPSPEERDRAIADFQDLPQDWTVTLHADAGWKDGRARYAYLLRSHLPPFKVEEVHEGECANSGDAEYMAVTLGLRAIAQHFGWGTPAGTVFIRSDYKVLIETLRKVADQQQREGLLTSMLLQPTLPERVRLLLEALPPAHITLNVKHVYGHQKNRTTAAWANNRVDELSSMRGK